MNVSKKNKIIIAIVVVCVIGLVFMYRPLRIHQSEELTNTVVSAPAPIIPTESTTTETVTPQVETPNEPGSTSPEQIVEPTTPPALPEFNETSIAKYNGDDATLPIYIAFEGLVYDVSPGREFYEPGAVYHYFAGTDGTDVLRLVGGDIIQRKYKVVGTFVSGQTN